MADEYPQLKKPGDRVLDVIALPGLTATEHKLMVVLAVHDGPGGCKPSIDRLAGILNLHRVTVYDHLKNIRKKGYLTWQKWHTTNLYKLVYQPIDKFVDCKEIPYSEPETVDCKDLPPVDCKEIPYGKGKKGRREEGKTPVYQEENLSTTRTQRNKTLVGYREEELTDGTKITVPVYE